MYDNLLGFVLTSAVVLEKPVHCIDDELNDLGTVTIAKDEPSFASDIIDLSSDTEEPPEGGFHIQSSQEIGESLIKEEASNLFLSPCDAKQSKRMQSTQEISFPVSESNEEEKNPTEEFIEIGSILIPKDGCNNMLCIRRGGISCCGVLFLLNEEGEQIRISQIRKQKIPGLKWMDNVGTTLLNRNICYNSLTESIPFSYVFPDVSVDAKIGIPFIKVKKDDTEAVNSQLLLSTHIWKEKEGSTKEEKEQVIL